MSKQNPSSKAPAAPAAPAPAIAKGAGDARASSALARLKAQFKKEAPPPKALPSSGSNRGLRVQGVVVRTTDGTIKVTPKGGGPKHDAKKRDFLIAVTKVLTVDDASYLGSGPVQLMLPVKKRNAGGDQNAGGPEGGGGGDRFSNAGPELNLYPGFPTMFLGIIKVGLFLQGPQQGGKAAENKPGLDLCVPGMPVEFAGLRGEPGSDGTGMWINNGDLRPLLDGGLPVAGGGMMAATKAIQQMIDTDHTLMANSALTLGMSFHGFFSSQFATPAEQEQADAFKEAYAKVPTALATALDAKAVAIRSRDAQGAAALDQYAATLRGFDPASIARGAIPFPPHLADSEKYPKNIAAISHRACSPALEGIPEVLLRLCDDTPPAPGSIPPMFAIPQIAHVVHDATREQQDLVRVYSRLTFIGDVNKAIAATRADPSAQTALFFSEDIAFGFTMWLERFAKQFGVNVVNKAQMLCTELLPYADFAAFVGITPRAPGSDGRAATPFANGIFFHVPNSIGVCSARVSEEWAIKHLARGDSRGSRYRQPAGTALINTKDTNGADVPLVATTNLAIDGFAAASEMSFDFANEKLPGNMTGRSYHVVCPGIAAAVAADEGITTDTEAGEATIERMAGDASAVTDWLDQNAVVYCLATMAA